MDATRCYWDETLSVTPRGGFIRSPFVGVATSVSEWNVKKSE